MFSSTAKVEYHTNWVIAICDPQLLNYYRWWIHHKTSVWLSKPMNNAHISLVRGDLESGTWERNMDGGTVTFFYDGELEHHENYIWLPVWGEDLCDVREKLHFSRKPLKPFHMSVGMVDMGLSEVIGRWVK